MFPLYQKTRRSQDPIDLGIHVCYTDFGLAVSSYEGGRNVTRSIYALMLAVLIISGCSVQPISMTTPEAAVGMPNPASQHCTDEGGRLEIRDEAGGQVGYCIFPDGSQCEEWAFYRGECAPAGGYQPLDPADCASLADAMTKTVGVDVATGEAGFEDYVTGESGQGCQATATGTGADFQSLSKVADSLREMLTVGGWTEDMQYAADGPTGTAAGFRHENSLCLMQVGWKPSPDADCPSDQPISACNLAPEQQLYTIGLNCAEK